MKAKDNKQLPFLKADPAALREQKLSGIMSMRFTLKSRRSAVDGSIMRGSTPEEIARLDLIQASDDPVAAMDAWTEELRIAFNIEAYGRPDGPTPEQVSRVRARVAKILNRK